MYVQCSPRQSQDMSNMPIAMLGDCWSGS